MIVVEKSVTFVELNRILRKKMSRLFKKKDSNANPMPTKNADQMYIDFLSKKTGLPEGEIKVIIEKHFGSGNNQQLNREQFLQTYEDLVLGNTSDADALTNLIFTAFDTNGDKLISLKEFLVTINFF